MNLQPHDLHMLLDPSARRLKLFNADGVLVLTCEARNRTTADGQYGHDGNCPPGSYVLGYPVHKESVPFGFWFLPILDVAPFHAMQEHGRQGIGIHGGGTGLDNPFASFQGWQITHGCWRLQNFNLSLLVPLVTAAQQAGGRCYVTVEAVAPGAGEGPQDYATRVILAEGE